MMTAKTRIALWACLFIAITLGLIWQFYPLPDAGQRINSLPLISSGYQGEDLPLTPVENDFFSGVNVIKRIYKVGSELFFITILDGTKNRHVVHDPYYCFKGSGWSIENKESIPVLNGEAELLKIKKNGETKQALFWFSDGVKNYTSPYEYWLQTTWRRLTLGDSGPEPVLIIVQPFNADAIDWKKLEKLMPELFSI